MCWASPGTGIRTWVACCTFSTNDGAVCETFTPSFNTLTVFRVPAPHVVSYVSPWVTGERLSVTGWFTVY